MSELQSNTLYNAVRNSDKIMLTKDMLTKDKYSISCCCISEKWWFDHTGLPSIKTYDKNTNNCCICLDCCTWCLEFQIKRYSICVKPTNIYLCCCSIYFI